MSHSIKQTHQHPWLNAVIYHILTKCRGLTRYEKLGRSMCQIIQPLKGNLFWCCSLTALSCGILGNAHITHWILGAACRMWLRSWQDRVLVAFYCCHCNGNASFMLAACCNFRVVVQVAQQTSIRWNQLDHASWLQNTACRHLLGRFFPWFLLFIF